MSYCKKMIASVVLTALVSSQAWLALGNTDVRVTMWNNVAAQDMKVHCKSSSSDLGIWSLPYHQTYEFLFSDVSLEDGDFYCSFDIGGVVNGFDIYVGKRDSQVCGYNKKLCRWVIQQNGPCSVDTSTCYGWN